MAFIKYISPNDFSRDLPPLQTIKIAKQRKYYHDKLAFEKRAGKVFDYEEIIKLARPGEYLVHVIALGCDEVYGPNRNGDAFTIDTCQKYHNTFTKFARWYRNHNHHDPRKSYGVVKKSAFNARDGRIELIVALNATKEAAQRNGGRVADKEIEILESGDDVAVSMACKVAYDVCSGCGNKARSRAEYCDEDICKYGGLKNNIGKTFEDGHILRAFNPEPKFFDISFVERPADRIAYSIGTIKSASYIPWLLPLPTRSEVEKQLKTLGALAYLERTYEGDVKIASAFHPSHYRLREIIPHIKYLDIPESVYTLTKFALVLPPEDFLICYGDFREEDAVKVGAVCRSHLPNVFNRLLHQSDINDLLAHNFFYPRPPENFDKVAEQVLYKLAAQKSLISPPAIDSVVKTANYNFVKRVNDENIIKLADTYGLYQLASLSEWIYDRDTTFRNIINMNRTF